MSTFNAERLRVATDVRFGRMGRRVFLQIVLEDGSIFAAPLSRYPTLLRASSRVRENWRFIGPGVGIHWEDLDYDLSVDGVIEGIPEIPRRRRRAAPPRWNPKTPVPPGHRVVIYDPSGRPFPVGGGKPRRSRRSDRKGR